MLCITDCISVLQNLSGKRGSNSRPSAWEADALPTELLPQVAVVVGFDDAKVITFSGIAKVATAFFTRGGESRCHAETGEGAGQCAQAILFVEYSSYIWLT